MEIIDSPSLLPWCIYPKAKDTSLHGLLELPDEVPAVSFESIHDYRSKSYKTISISQFSNTQIIEMARMMANSFAKNEPMNKHVHPPKSTPSIILDTEYNDPFGMDAFGPWTTENILFWFVRTMILTNPFDPIGEIGLNKEVYKHSLAIEEDGVVIGGAFNMTLSFDEVILRTQDPFMDAVFQYQSPIVNFFYAAEKEALAALGEKYPLFKSAHQTGKVGYISMIARSPKLPSSHIFELFAASFEHFQKEGCEYMVITATNNWTGAASETMGAVRIYFSPFRDKPRVLKTQVENENEPHSEDGFISAKDSGAMIYCVKLHS